MRHTLAIVGSLGLILAATPRAAPARQQPAAAIAVDADRVFEDVRQLASDDMQGRLAGSPGGEKARAYIVTRLEQAGVLPLGGSFEQPFTFTAAGRRGAAPAPGHGVNLIGIIKGSRDPERYIVATAHYDHLGVRNGEVFNGADDNASGVAALLALATHYSRSRPLHSILVAVLDAEEEGLQGARALMKAPPVPVASMIVNVNMDMVGRDPSNKLFATGISHFPFLKPYLAQAAQPPVVLAYGHDTPAEKEDWTRDSDHYAFHQAGIPWIYFGVEDFDQHHKATDDAATIGKAFLAGAAGTIIAATHELDLHLEEIAARRQGSPKLQ